MNPGGIRLDPEGLRRCILRQGAPERVYHFEHGVEQAIVRAFAERFGLADPSSELRGADYRKRQIAVHRFMGHELIRTDLPGSKPFRLSGRGGAWEEEGRGPVQARADLDSVEWTDPGDIDYEALDWYEKNLPPDMGIFSTTRIWESVRPLFGFESFCYKLYEEPDLVDDVIARVAEFNLRLVKTLCQYECLFAIYGIDDLGFKTGTFLPPETIREKFLVHHREMARIAHEHGKLYLFHSCGKLDEIMDWVIDDVRVDAKHSFEDVITPVTEAKRLWGDRVGLLGGVDVDFMARAGEADIRRRTRETLEVCMPGGGYCLGMGNWVTAYTPPENYLYLLDEARRFS